MTEAGTQPFNSADQFSKGRAAINVVSGWFKDEFTKLGVDLILTAFLHFQEELEAFGKTVIPIVREKETELVNKGLLAAVGV